jgi:hypothetical protein
MLVSTAFYCSGVSRFNRYTLRWALLSGDPIGGSVLVPVYSARRKFDPLATPGPRDSTQGGVVSESGALVFYGGFSTLAHDGLPDAWAYSSTTHHWSWFAGSNLTNPASNTNIGKGVPMAGDLGPGPRHAHVLWWNNGVMYLFGG